MSVRWRTSPTFGKEMQYYSILLSLMKGWSIVSSDYDAKTAIKARDDFKKQNGRDDPNLVSRAASECAKLKNEYSAKNVIQPLWLKNERG